MPFLQCFSTANIRKNPLLPSKSSGFFVFSLVFSFRGS
nr:MAG TPA: hypothetical protein [Caudoviricetes sp.]DAN58846.1 MAG TPA: hypothetical protein [Caudoviricetes sp.]